jgi:hypothetical protein
MRAFITFLLAIAWLVAPVWAGGDGSDFEYDIFLNKDTISVWLDLRPALEQSKMEDLLAGLDLWFGIELNIEKPRKLFFSRTIASTQAGILISHPLTEDTYHLRLINFSRTDREFDNQIELSDFLADSLIFRISHKSLIEGISGVRLSLTITCKSLSNNLLNDIWESSEEFPPNQSEGEDEFFESLFNLFLNLIGFGKTSNHLVSPTFSLEDLTSF